MSYEFLAWVNQYVGLPFTERGRDEHGVDCWGLVAIVLRDVFGITVPSYDDEYKTTTDCESISNVIEREASSWWLVSLDEAQAGDVIVMRVLPYGAPKNIYGTHVGIIVERDWMLHVERDINVVIERYTRPRWGRRVVGIYRHDSLYGKE